MRNLRRRLRRQGLFEMVPVGLQTLDGGTHPLRNELGTTCGTMKIPLGDLMTVSHLKYMGIFYLL